MAQVAVLTDSTAYLPPDLVSRYHIRVVPLKIHWKGQTFRDGIDMTPTEFYERLDRDPAIPTTSQPSIQEFIQAFEELAQQSDGIVASLLSSGISGTVDSARSAVKEFSSVPVEIIDTHSTSAGQGLVTLAAARAAEAGKSLAEVKTIAQAAADDLDLYAMVDTLKYLHRGGRIAGVARFMGTALNMKPIVYFDKTGKLDGLERVRTHHKALERLVELAVKKVGDSPTHVGVFHAKAPDGATYLKGELAKRLVCDEIGTYELSPVIGIHVGPGVVGLALYRC